MHFTFGLTSKLAAYLSDSANRSIADAVETPDAGLSSDVLHMQNHYSPRKSSYLPASEYE
ncbi:MAG: hypothetical protein V1725_01285 [archaeon]